MQIINNQALCKFDNHISRPQQKYAAGPKNKIKMNGHLRAKECHRPRWVFSSICSSRNNALIVIDFSKEVKDLGRRSDGRLTIHSFRTSFWIGIQSLAIHKRESMANFSFTSNTTKAPDKKKKNLVRLSFKRIHSSYYAKSTSFCSPFLEKERTLYPKKKEDAGFLVIYR